MSYAITAGVLGVAGTAYSAYEQSQSADDIQSYQSPQSKVFWKNLGRPVTQDIAGAFQQIPRGPYGLWDIPALPEMPNLPQASYMSDIPMYDIPSMPTYNNMSPEMRNAFEQPFVRGSELLSEQLGGMGQMGSIAAGPSGAGADVLRQYWTEAAPQLQNAALQYGMPMWQQELARNVAGRSEAVEEGRMAYEQDYAQTYQNLYQNPVQMYNMQLQQNSLPWTSTLGILPQYATASQPVISAPSYGSQLAGAYGPMLAQSGFGSLFNNSGSTGQTYSDIGGTFSLMN